MHSRRRRLAPFLLALVAAIAISLPWPAQASKPRHHLRPSSDVVANLFEWNWPSVARECQDHLGPDGYGAVQVSVPTDSLKRQHLGDGSDTILHPWWEVYQPADYKLDSRMGNEQQFSDMISTCRAAGVQVIVDVVMNHMSGQGDTSYDGVHFSKYDYPGTYASTDFHGPMGECPSASGGIEDWNDPTQVWHCELSSLSDLRTETTYVRNQLSAYLNHLLALGVSGFRVDAAKHIGETDLSAIYQQLNDTVDGTRPYWALEVFGGGSGELSPGAFTSVGSVLGLDGVKQLRDAFRNTSGAQIGSLAALRDFGEGTGLTPSDKTLQFVQNHDTERNGDALSYKDGARNILANQFLLAFGYGRPQVYAGFEWQTSDDSPPANADGYVTDTDCSNGWACVDRDPAVTGLVRWHDAVGDAARANWWDDGHDVIAFNRGDRGWVVFNGNDTAVTQTFATHLSPGTYDDLAHAGTKVTVADDGTATLTLSALSAVAITTSG